MVTKPIGQVHLVDPAGGEIEHETRLVIDGGVDLSATEMYEKPGRSTMSPRAGPSTVSPRAGPVVAGGVACWRRGRATRARNT
jgi:hypothetical protein